MNQQPTLILNLKLNLRYIKFDLIFAFRQNHLQMCPQNAETSKSVCVNRFLLHYTVFEQLDTAGVQPRNLQSGGNFHLHLHILT